MTRIFRYLVRCLVDRPLVFFVAYATWLSAEYWVLGWSSYLSVHDHADHYMPIILWWARWRKASTPLLPALSGIDQLSAMTWLNALTWCFRVFPPWLANGVVAWFQRFCSSYFTYRLLKDEVRLSKAASYAAAMMYPLMYFEYGEMRYMHGLDEPGLPLLIWGLCRVAHAHHWWLGIAGLSALFSATAGPFIGVPFLAPVAFISAWCIKVDTEKWRRVSLRLVLAFLVLLAVIYVPRLDTLHSLYANSAFSHRAQWVDHGSGPDVFLGAVQERAIFAFKHSFFVLIAGYVLLSRTTERRLRWILGILLFFGFALGPLATWMVRELSHYLGFLKGFTAARFSKAAPFALVVGVSLAIHALRLLKWNEMSWPRSDLLAAAGVSACCLLLSWQIKTHRYEAVRHAGKNWRIIFQNPALKQIVLRSNHKYRWATAAAYHDMHPMYMLGYGVEIADGYVDMHPRWYHAYWERMIGPLLRQDRGKRGFFQWGHRGYLFLPCPSVWPGCEPMVFEDWYRLSLLSLLNVKYLVSAFPLENANLRILHHPREDALRQRWELLSWSEKLKAYWRGTAPPGRRLYIYENTQAFPRVFAVPRAKKFASEDDLYSALEEASVRDFQESVYLAAETEHEHDAEDVSGDAHVIEFDQPLPHRYRVTVKVQGSAWLVVSQLYYPWWVCRVDGVERPVIRVNGCLIGVPLTEGDSVVELEYAGPP